MPLLLVAGFETVFAGAVVDFVVLLVVFVVVFPGGFNAEVCAPDEAKRLRLFDVGAVSRNV